MWTRRIFPAICFTASAASRAASGLGAAGSARYLFVLDEPTTGLHFEDIRKLMGVLQRLVARGNTVVVIEHNLDVIKNADWVIDLGPEGGDKGGTIVAQGTPEDVAKNPKSFTGKYLKEVLKNRGAAVALDEIGGTVSKPRKKKSTAS